MKMMGRIRGPVLAVAALSLAGGIGCQKDDRSMETALQRIDDRLAKMEAQLARAAPARAGAAAAGPGAPSRRPARPPGPAPEAVYSVPIDGAPFVGAKDARVTVVEAFEFACPFCLRVKPTLEQLLRDYQGKIKIVYKHLIVHPGSATTPAHAACAAAEQGKFAAMYAGIWTRGFSAGRNLSKDNMLAIAEGIGLDMDRFTRDMDGDACKQRVARDQQELRKVGARATPAFFINGRYLSGARPIDQFKKLIDEELAKANQRIASGTAVADYYRQWVVDRGKKTL
jgi:protein-disulfide isomerase